ncbi:MAG: alpha/beta fold hydrolase [Planctomycetes bacterium]|nr:alpha/beta fold hydrolase [Planctomycetota bacterium]
MPDLNARFPSSLMRVSTWTRLVNGSVPVVMMRPEKSTQAPLPFLLWFHGRTVDKETDPGRYLRLVRAGIGCIAVDLPGHGERPDASMQDGSRTAEVVEQAASEIDGILADASVAGFDPTCTVLGGLSAGGMAAALRGCSDHPFRGFLLEATTGDWSTLCGRAGFPSAAVERLNPLTHLVGWRECPVLALHATLDEWIPVEGQRRFIAALQAKSVRGASIELHEYARTDAPHEHMGFGRMASDAKSRGTRFIAACCGVELADSL